MSANENMGFDAMFLSAWPFCDVSRLRFYTWAEACSTCGLSQKREDFFNIISGGEILVRRPTGGGLVRHEEGDCTYALAVPSVCGFYKIRPRDSYFMLHETIAGALKKFGIESNILRAPEIARGPAQCFAAASAGDLFAAGKKIAGAAQKRTRKGMLIQGSIKPGAGIQRAEFENALAKDFAKMLSEGLSLGEFPERGVWSAFLGAFGNI